MKQSDYARIRYSRWGTNAHGRASNSSSSPTLREAARQAAELLSAVRDSVIDKAVRAVLTKQIATLQFDANYFRFCVVEGQGSHEILHGLGDTWEDAVADADARASRRETNRLKRRPRQTKTPRLQRGV